MLDALLRRIVAEEVERVVRPAVDALRDDVAAALSARPPDAAPAMLTTAQAAELMAVSQRTVRRWLADGRLRAYGTSGALRVRRDELLALRPDLDDDEARDIPARALEIVRKHG